MQWLLDLITKLTKDGEKTDAYSLAKWIGHYTKRTSGSVGRRLQEAEKRSFDYSSSYSPYYIMELQDGFRLFHI